MNPAVEAMPGTEPQFATPAHPEPNAPSGKILVLGLGNDILTDDAIGLEVVREVSRRVEGDSRVDVKETMEMGLALLDFIVGYDTLILVDSIQTGRAAPGYVHDLTREHLSAQPGRTPHFLGVKDTLLLGARLGLPMPERVRILAVEVEDPFTLGSEMTSAVRCALPFAVEQILALVATATARPGGLAGPSRAA
jgi:hydrogenase maturation protease